MEHLFNAFKMGWGIILSGDPEFLGIVLVSVKASLMSTLMALVLGVPLGLVASVFEFRGRKLLHTFINACMSIPTVVIGLLVYTFLSRNGLLGSWGLLYTLPAMVIGQVFLAMPLIAGFIIATIKHLDPNLFPTIATLNANKLQTVLIVIQEIRLGIVAAAMAGFGRVFSEIGVAMMLGGNIRNYTRTITTAIALETSKGEFSLAIALGMILIAIAFSINFAVMFLQSRR